MTHLERPRAASKIYERVLLIPLPSNLVACGLKACDTGRGHVSLRSPPRASRRLLAALCSRLWAATYRQEFFIIDIAVPILVHELHQHLPAQQESSHHSPAIEALDSVLLVRAGCGC